MIDCTHNKVYNTSAPSMILTPGTKWGWYCLDCKEQGTDPIDKLDSGKYCSTHEEFENIIKRNEE